LPAPLRCATVNAAIATATAATTTFDATRNAGRIRLSMRLRRVR
jgi:hypothetical protein